MAIAGRGVQAVGRVISRGASAVGRGFMAAHQWGGLGFVLSGAGIMWAFSWVVKNWNPAKERWWVAPAIMGAIGLYLYRRGGEWQKWGIVALVLSGAMFMKGWEANNPATGTAKNTQTQGILSLQRDTDGTYALRPDTGAPALTAAQDAAESLMNRISRYQVAA